MKEENEMKKNIAAALAILSLSVCAQAYDKADFIRQYRDTISIVETNYKEEMPISEYERIQIFKKEFLVRAAEFGPRALLEKTLALATNPRQLLAEDNYGRTVLFYAADAETVDSLVLRLQQLETKEQLGTISSWTSQKAVKTPKARKIAEKFINKTDKEGAPALFVLLRDGKTSAARRLIERGADLNVKDADKVTALHMAVLEASDDNPQAQALVKQIAGKNPYLAAAKDRDGRTPADWAKRGGYGQTRNYLADLAKRVEASQRQDLQDRLAKMSLNAL